MSAISSSLGPAEPVTDAFGALSSEEFLEVIFTELQAQDPLAPNDTGALLAQLATIRAIESDMSLTSSIEELVKRSEISSASSLVGAFVTGVDQAGAAAAGFVDSVLVTSGGSVLMLSSGAAVPIDGVSEIIDPVLIGVDDGSGSGGGADGADGSDGSEDEASSEDDPPADGA